MRLYSARVPFLHYIFESAKNMKSRLLLDAKELKIFHLNAPTVLDNANCVYCAVELSPTTRTKEHVVGRRFIPRGKLDGGWNLIAYACASCNNSKSRLEDELAAISMQPDSYGKYAVDDETLRTEATRKAANSYSSKTRRPIADSSEAVKFETRHPSGALMSFSFESSAQVGADKMYELCRLQVCAFFYMLTFDSVARRGGFWRGSFLGIADARRPDWGSERLSSFAETVKDWEPRLLSTNSIADGFYKLAIRKHPTDDCWSWALEWNHSIRCVGLFGDRETCDEVEKFVARDVAQLVIDEPKRKVAYRLERALVQSGDVLFRYKEIEI